MHTPEREPLVLDLPQDLRGRQVEIIAFAVDEEGSSNNKKLPASAFYGILSPEFGDELRRHVESSREEWVSPFEDK